MALISGGQQCGEGDLLAVVGGVDVDSVVVNADSVVRVSRGDRDLEGGGEEICGGEVEGVDGGVLEDEMWLGGAEDDPYDEDDEEDEDDEAEKGRNEAAVELFPVMVVVAALLGRHVGVALAVVEISVLR